MAPHITNSPLPSGAARLDSDAAARVFQQGATTRRPGPTWTHLDLHPGNVLTNDGELAGIIDWSESAAGHPAADLGQALVLVGQDGWDALMIGYGTIDARTFSRARRGHLLLPHVHRRDDGATRQGRVGRARGTRGRAPHPLTSTASARDDIRLTS